jgi:hypothetical protein
LAVGQTQLLDGVHLPDVVGVHRRVPLLGGLAAGRRRRLAQRLPVALQGAFAGQGQVGMQLGQADADEAGSPGGMGLVEEQGLLEQGVVREGAPVGRPILRGAGLPVVLAEVL